MSEAFLDVRRFRLLLRVRSALVGLGGVTRPNVAVLFVNIPF